MTQPATPAAPHPSITAVLRLFDLDIGQVLDFEITEDDRKLFAPIVKLYRDMAYGMGSPPTAPQSAEVTVGLREMLSARDKLLFCMKNVERLQDFRDYIGIGLPDDERTRLMMQESEKLQAATLYDVEQIATSPGKKVAQLVPLTDGHALIFAGIFLKLGSGANDDEQGLLLRIQSLRALAAANAAGMHVRAALRAFRRAAEIASAPKAP